MNVRSLFQLIPDRPAFDRRRLVVGMAITVLGLLIPLWSSKYLMTVFAVAYFFVVLSESWNLISGFTGYLSLGHSMFIGIGAFTTFILFGRYDVNWILALLVGGVLAAIIAVLVGIPSLRIRGVYFAIATLVLNEVARLLAEGPLAFLTNGTHGMTVFSGPSVRTIYYALGGLALVTVVFSMFIVNSKIGLHMRAIQERERVAESMGIHTTGTKLFVFAASAFFPAIAGGLYGFTISYIDPSVVFNVRFTLDMTVMTIIGGIGTITGPLVGAFAFGLLSEVLVLSAPEVFQIALGLFLIVVILFNPDGIYGFVTSPRIRSFIERFRR